MWRPADDYSVGTTGNSVLLDALADPTHRITATPDLAPGDILQWQGDAEVFADGSFAARASFQVGIGESWAWQTMLDVAEPEPPPVVEPPPPEPEPPAPEPPPPEPPPKEKGPPPGKGWRK